MRVTLRISAALLLVAAGLRAEDASPSKIVGTWRGTSTCVDRQAAPACNDERVVYEIKPVAGASDRVSVQADKIVNGGRGTMGVIEFHLAKDGSWMGEFDSPRSHSVWRLVVDGDRVAGTGTQLPSNAVVRKIELAREK